LITLQTEEMNENLHRLMESDDFKNYAYINEEDITQIYGQEPFNNSTILFLKLPSNDCDIHIPKEGEIASYFKQKKIDKNSPEYKDIEEVLKAKWAMFVNGDTSKMTLYALSDKKEEEGNEKDEYKQILQSMMMFYKT